MIDTNNNYLSCASDKGTVHVFAIGPSEIENKKSTLNALGGGYFGAQWSFGQFKIKDSKSKIALLDDKIFAVSTQGNYFYGNIAKDSIPI